LFQVPGRDRIEVIDRPSPDIGVRRGVVVRRHESPVLITGAAISPAEEFAARRRRYSLIMSLRIPCLVIAGVLALGFGWTIAAAVLVVASVPLPWMAVLIANDAPPRKAEKVASLRSDHVVEARPLRALEPGMVIDGPSDRAA
jgi:hypothetical protein